MLRYDIPTEKKITFVADGMYNILSALVAEGYIAENTPYYWDVRRVLNYIDDVSSETCNNINIDTPQKNASSADIYDWLVH